MAGLWIGNTSPLKVPHLAFTAAPSAAVFCLMLDFSAAGVTFCGAVVFFQMLMLAVSVVVGVFVHVVVAILINNLSPRRTYPAFW